MVATTTTSTNDCQAERHRMAQDLHDTPVKSGSGTTILFSCTLNPGL